MVAHGRFSDHPEDVTRLWPGHVRPDHGRIPAGSRTGRGGQRQRGPGQWWDDKAPHRSNGGGYAHGPGYGKFFVHNPRNQRVLTKAMVTYNHGAQQAWYKHGAYLDRDGTQEAGRGYGFDAHGDPVTMSTVLAGWQRAGDPHEFRVILSPEHGERLDLRAFTQTVMREIEHDLKQPLEWVAIDHDNTDQPHVHLHIRGVSEGKPVTMAKTYLRGGIQARAREVATRMLGFRLAPEMIRAAHRAVARERWSVLDQSISAKLSPHRTVPDKQLTAHERQRLEVLVERGLAWRNTEEWQLSTRWEDIKMESQERGKKAPEVEREEEKPQRSHEQQREAEREQDEQQRRVVQIDDLEQDLGWER